AMAPGANIMLVEATDNSVPAFGVSNLDTAVAFAAKQPGVVAVSMSWGGNETSNETLSDARYLTPKGHNGVVFIAAAGDSGAIPSYPPSSPNVVAVGGTSLFLDSHS